MIENRRFTETKNRHGETADESSGQKRPTAGWGGPRVGWTLVASFAGPGGRGSGQKRPVAGHWPLSGWASPPRRSLGGRGSLGMSDSLALRPRLYARRSPGRP